MPRLVRRIHEGFSFDIGGLELIPDIGIEMQPRANGQPEEVTAIRLVHADDRSADVILFGRDDLERFHAMIGARLNGVVVPTPQIVLPGN